MDRKENKNGLLKNSEVEQDLNAKGRPAEDEKTYTGAQDNGDSMVRPLGDAVQRADGRPPEQVDENGES